MMAVRSLVELRERFEKGDQPTAQDFIDLFDSFLHAQLGNFPDPLPAVSGANLTDIPIPDPLPAVSGANLTGINPSQWDDLDDTPSYATATSFVLPGDYSGRFPKAMRVKLVIAGSDFTSEVDSSSYSAGPDATTVNIVDPMPSNQLTAAAVSIFTPYPSGALSPGMLGLTATVPAAQFAPHEASTPNMTVVVDAGYLYQGRTFISKAQQTTATITAPVTNDRIDRVVIDQATGDVSVVAGTEAASPSAPAVPYGRLPVAQVYLQVGVAAITDAIITDERVFSHNPLHVAGDSVLLAAKGQPYLASNAYLDGATWNRYDTAQASSLVTQDIATGKLEFWTAAAGANPIASWTKYDLRSADSHVDGTTNKVFTAAEQSKLGGIEPGATADQSAAEIKTAYESNTDTNAFTDAEKSKLGGIETGATADQTAVEIKTAYESNTDTNAFTDAEKSKLGGIETGATADQSAAEIKTAYESNTDTNAFTDAEQGALASLTPAAITGFAQGRTLFVDDDIGVASPTLDMSANTAGTWYSYGPTGSTGFANHTVWSLLDALPASTKFLLAVVVNDVSGATAEYISQLYAQKYDGSTSGPLAWQVQSRAACKNIAGQPSRGASSMLMVVPVDSQGRFKTYRTIIGDTPSINALEFKLIGFGVE